MLYVLVVGGHTQRFVVVVRADSKLSRGVLCERTRPDAPPLLPLCLPHHFYKVHELTLLVNLFFLLLTSTGIVSVTHRLPHSWLSIRNVYLCSGGT